MEVVKDEVDTIEQRTGRGRTRSPTRTPKKESPKKETPKKETPKKETPKKESPKKEEDNEPESKIEPKGKPGRPRSASAKPVEPSSSSSSRPKAASSAAAAAAEDEMTQVTSKSELRKANKTWLVKQLELRGFQGKKLTEIKKMNKQEVFELVEKLIDEEKWV